MSRLLIICTAVTIFGCQYFQQKTTIDEKIVARANESFLYEKDLEGLIPAGSSPSDSSELTKKYVDSWVRKQLMIDKAANEIEFNQAEIDRKLLAYRYSLLIHEFEKFYISTNLNEEVTQEEIERYYSERSENFLLKQNIIRCLYAKLPKGTPGLANFRRNIRGFPNANLDDVKDYCFQYAVDAFAEPEIWVKFEEIANTTPLKDVKNGSQFLETTTFSATSDNDFIYYLRILDYKVVNELSPIEFVQENIENIIVNKRKIELKQELEEAIYNEAKANNSFEIFSR